jgi:hypothetical protein
VRGGGRRAGRKTRAERADKYELYQEAVQDAEGDVKRLVRMYESEFGRKPRCLREDFCGTALLACAWASSHRDREAIGVDLDPEPLAWGRRHNLAELGSKQARRVHLVQGDVRRFSGPRTDLLAAFNFSYFTFQTRTQLRSYFEKAHAGLEDRGLFVLDAYGGPEAQEARTETREHDGFDYVWDQHRFDPITHRARCYIHFEFKDGSRLRRAFGYDWRLWMLPELQELLLEAGFDRADVYWEGADSKNEPNGVFRRRAHAPDDPAWIAYLVGVKGSRKKRRPSKG